MLWRLLSVLLVFVALCGTVRPQSDAAERRILYVNVLDKSGKAVLDLGSENFRGEFNGKPVKIVSATPEDGAGRVVLLMDVGPRMKQGTKWERAWAAAADMTKSLADNHPMAVFTIGDRLMGSSIFLSDHTRLNSVLTHMEKSLGAAQAPAVTPLVQAISILLGQPSLLRYGDLLLVITEAPLANDPHMPEEKVRAVGNQLSSAGVRLFKLTLFEDMASPSLYHFTQFDLDKAVVRACGGFNFDVVRRKFTPQELLAQLQEVYEAVKGGYRLEVEFPITIEKPHEWKLQVVDQSGRKLKDEAVSYSHLLVPGSGRNP